jgi:gliding motility-associated-like protein
MIKEKFIFIPGPMPRFVIFDSIGCAPLTVRIKDFSDSTSTWEFLKGDNTLSSFAKRPADSIFTVVYNKPGVYYLYLAASDSAYNHALQQWVSCVSVYGDTNDYTEPHFKITVLPNLPAAFSGDTLICSGQTATFTEQSHPDYDSLLWYFGDGSAVLRNGRGSVYHPYILPENCTDSIFITYMKPLDHCPDRVKYLHVRVVQTLAGIDTIQSKVPEYWFRDVSEGGNNSRVFIRGIDNPYYYKQFSISDTSFYYNFGNDSGRFKVCIVRTINRSILSGCPDTACMEVINQNHVGIYIPNIFTPGLKDGVNDQFIIWNKGVELWNLTILNRWGSVVYQTSDPTKHWDGIWAENGEDCSAGVYYYVLQYKLFWEDPNEVSGTVTLVR